jgi:predicted nucleotidyltransferase
MPGQTKRLCEAIDKQTQDAITGHFLSLDLWRDYRERASVVLVGSCAAGLADAFSDVDVDVLIEREDYEPLYQLYWEAVDREVMRILNPRARLFHEFPMTYIPGVHGHYQLKLAAQIEERIRSMDDVTRWIYAHSIAMADPRGLQARLYDLASTYPPDVLREKRLHQRRAAQEYYWGIKVQLQRDHAVSLALLCVQSISHLLKYCCLCDGEPYPHEKWLYQVAIATSLGKQIQPCVDKILAELRRDHVVYEVPSAYVDAGGRNETFENYRLYHLFKLLWEQASAFHKERFPQEIK